jgi:maltooligosyltrehalose trehalohydrolase
MAPFVPLLFMGDEVGATTPFPYFVSHGDPDLVEAVRQGRAREFAGFQGSGEPPDPQAESTFSSAVLPDAVTEVGEALRSWYRRLLALRRTNPHLRALDRDATSVSVHERGRALVISRGRNADVVIVLHFGEEPVDVGLPASGPWRVLADSNVVEVLDSLVRIGPWGAVVVERVATPA